MLLASALDSRVSKDLGENLLVKKNLLATYFTLTQSFRRVRTPGRGICLKDKLSLVLKEALLASAYHLFTQVTSYQQTIFFERMRIRDSCFLVDLF